MLSTERFLIQRVQYIGQMDGRQRREANGYAASPTRYIQRSPTAVERRHAEKDLGQVSEIPHWFVTEFVLVFFLFMLFNVQAHFVCNQLVDPGRSVIQRLMPEIRVI